MSRSVLLLCLAPLASACFDGKGNDVLTESIDAEGPPTAVLVR